MGTTTEIGWTDHTWNPWRGCEHAKLPDGSEHPGCAHCYAEAFAPRNPKVLGEWGPQGRRVVAAEDYWQLPFKWNREAEREGRRRRVFCASLADVFEDWQGPILDSQGKTVHNGKAWYDDRPFIGLDLRIGRSVVRLDDVRRRVIDVWDATPWIDWLVLTKRPFNVRRMWNAVDDRPAGTLQRRRENVWLGTSVSDQATADALIPELLKLRELTPVLFVSAEPLLEAITFRWQAWAHQATGETYREYLERTGSVNEYEGLRKLDWLIVGGESGPQRRDCGVEAIVQTARQAAEAGVPCFVKQDCAPRDGQQGRIPADVWSLKQFPEVAEAAA